MDILCKSGSQLNLDHLSCILWDQMHLLWLFSIEKASAQCLLELIHQQLVVCVIAVDFFCKVVIKGTHLNIIDT